MDLAEGTKRLRCMVCDSPTVFTFNMQGVEAAFCCTHLPRDKLIRKIELVVPVRNY